MGLAAFEKNAMLQANGADRARQNRLGVLGGGMTELGQMLSNFLVGLALLVELQDQLFHLSSRRKAAEGAHRDGHDGRGGFTTFPNDAGLDLVMGHMLDNDFIDQTAQQGFLL